MVNLFLRILSIIWVIIMVLPSTAHAYIDPGTGALVLQIILAAIAGILFFFKTARDKIIYFIKKPFKKTKKAASLSETKAEKGGKNDDYDKNKS